MIEHARVLSDGKYSSLGVNAFSNKHLRLKFADDSTAFFRYAFALIDEDEEEVAVFTEHCGYHVFPLVDTTIEVLEGDTDAG
jgi:hypothetical protein